MLDYQRLVVGRERFGAMVASCIHLYHFVSIFPKRRVAKELREERGF